MNPTPDANAFAEQFAQLQQSYRAQLPGKIAQMQQLLDSLLNAGWDAERGEGLYRAAHSLAGSGGSMGFPDVSDAARAFEAEVKRIVRHEASLEAQATKLRALLAQLSSVVAATDMPARGDHESTGVADLPPLQILVVDDEPGGQALLATYLRADGHTVFTASNGEEAVARFMEHRPDMVLMDVVMPRMDGYEAAKQIKAACGKHFVPLIFLTALQEDKDLVACVEAGGDAFLVKPYNRALLQAKLLAMHRIRELHRELERYQRKTEEELELSRHVFEAITDRNHATPAVSHWHSAVGHFSGDLLLYAYTPSGKLFVLQGDFTGHGLAAALGALPVSESFYAQVAEDVALPDLAASLNRKLKSVLPVGYFCAASILAVDPDGRGAEVWMGGMPDIWIFDDSGWVTARLKSRKLPLGVVGDAQFDATTERIDFQPGERALIISDGLTEATNAAGEMFGETGVALLLATGGRSVVSVLRAGVEAHLAGAEAHDDISIAVLDPAGVGRGGA